MTSRSPRRRRKGRGTASREKKKMIDAGFGYVADAKTAIEVSREYEQIGIYWLEEPFEPDEYEAYAELADTVDIRVRP